AGPANNHLVRVGVADFTVCDMAIITGPHSFLAIGREPSNASGRLPHHFVVTTTTITCWGRASRVSSLGLEVASQHTSIMKEAVEVGATQGNVMRLARGTGDGV